MECINCGRWEPDPPDDDNPDDLCPECRAEKEEADEQNYYDDDGD